LYPQPRTCALSHSNDDEACLPSPYCWSSSSTCSDRVDSKLANENTATNDVNKSIAIDGVESAVRSARRSNNWRCAVPSRGFRDWGSLNTANRSAAHDSPEAT